MQISLFTHILSVHEKDGLSIKKSSLLSIVVQGLAVMVFFVQKHTIVPSEKQALKIQGCHIISLHLVKLAEEKQRSGIIFQISHFLLSWKLILSLVNGCGYPRLLIIAELL